MTPLKPSKEAYAVLRKIRSSYGLTKYFEGKYATIIQSALDAARNQALEDAASMLEAKIIVRDYKGMNNIHCLADSSTGYIGMTQIIFADAIRDLKTKPPIQPV